MELAEEDSQITGNRFVVELEGSLLWGRRACVVDASQKTVVASGLSFKDASDLAEKLNKAHTV